MTLPPLPARRLLFGLGLCLALAHSSSAQDRELRIGDLPAIRIGVGVMQSAQYLEADPGAFDPADVEASPGFHRVRFNLLLAMDVTDRIKAVVDLGHEPNDFGADFAPAVDYVALDLLLAEALTLRLGTPVTALFNYRGYSDGAYVQDNPLIGNSPADMVTAETGVQLLGVVDPVRFDLTATVPTFFEDFGTARGFTLIGKASAEVTEGVGVGAAALLGTNGGQVGQRPFGEVQVVGLVYGDGENYNFPGSTASARDTHAGTVPGLDVRGVHADAQLDRDDLPLLVRAWYGRLWDDYSFVDGEGDFTVASQAVGFAEEASEVDFFGSTVAVDLTEEVYLAGRFTLVRNLSDWADSESNALTRIQAGVGVRFWDHALLKAEYVRQSEEVDSPGQIGADWQGALLELSVVF